MSLAGPHGGGVLALVLGILPGIAHASPEDTEPASLTRLAIAFKLDPLVLGTTYGERWLAGPHYTGAIQPGAVGTVDVRVNGRDALGRPVSITPEWRAADPNMLTVTPRRKDEFRITVSRPGESALTVASHGLSRKLLVRARKLGDAIQVVIDDETPSESVAGDGGEPTPAPTDRIEPTSALPDQKARSSYAMGLEMGRRLKETSVELEVELVSRGIEDALRGDGILLTDEERRAALAALRADFQRKRGEARRRLAEDNERAGEAFLEANGAREGVVTLESGVQYRVLRTGDGPRPGADDRVVCRYRGTLVDGREFDSSYERGKPSTFSLKRAVAGWREALQLMPVGSQWEIVLPANLAYGERGTRKVGPNATLIFEVELLGIEE